MAIAGFVIALLWSSWSWVIPFLGLINALPLLFSILGMVEKSKFGLGLAGVILNGLFLLLSIVTSVGLIALFAG